MEHRDVKDIAKDIRVNLKKEIPECKFSVSIERYSGGQAINLNLMTAPKSWFKPRFKIPRHRSLPYDEIFTEDGHEKILKAKKIANKENWDNSDSMTDYSDVNYFFHFFLGNYGKDFEATANV